MAPIPEFQSKLLKGRVAVVTGASSGIGRATARLLAHHGARVTIGDIRLDPANDAEFARLGISQHLCDVCDVSQLRTLIDAAAGDAGRLDVLVNNAGIVMVGPVEEIKESDWDRCLDTNLKAAFFGVQFALP
ncbi:MAG: SDR family NAD(P)-dependent oxidoreductase, partial [Planctomycetaceae bacterium]|nr:SDR family NAD(P)-dependent oxidoreductase [Planctomycetaceae bacterium]